MPAPLDNTKRAAILTDIQAGQLSRNAIARKHHVAPSTVTKLAKDTGTTTAFDRTHAEKGARARRFDAKLARAQLIQDLYGDAQRFRERAWDQYTQVVGGQAGPELVTTRLPPLRDQQAGYTALAICVDKATKLEQVDVDTGGGVGRGMISDLRDALGLAYEAMVADEETPPGEGRA